MTLQIRRYRDSEHEQVVHLHRVALEAVGAYVGSGPCDQDLNQIEQSYINSRGQFLVGVRGEDVADLGAVRQVDSHTAELKRMRVSPGLQRRGFGRRLLHALQARALDLGYTTLVLDTSERQVAAMALYRAEGYLDAGHGQLAGLPILFFRKALNPEKIKRVPSNVTSPRPEQTISG